MLTGDLKEKDASEINLPDEDPTTFALFLRHTLPGFVSFKLTGIVRLIKIFKCEFHLYNWLLCMMSGVLEPNVRHIHRLLYNCCHHCDCFFINSKLKEKYSNLKKKLK